ncbi:ABC transporter permease subunit [Pseudalkalibacillus caeni]|uniref:ABC transporter permease subunit n=2 Tax=Exobacillus caeni TaxID=2574798 RepID=A0A5R9F5Z7_9BACL|nr:ABC transporter permease subunit [Pseudalkalibacillus caeni]
MLYLLPGPFRITLTGLADSLHYAPLTVFTYILIAPVVVVFSWSYDTSTKIIYPMIILMLVSVPVLSIYIMNELNAITKKEFIASSRIMGGGFFHIYRKHVVPFINPKLWLLFVQQVGQVLIIFAHLGLLKVFIGGTDIRVIEYDQKTGEPIKAAFSMSNEWAGLIAQNFQYATSYPWMVLAPVSAFALTILSINCIVYELKNPIILKKQRKKRQAEKVRESHSVTPESFQFKG